MSDARNVLGEPLQPCCTANSTGFFRDGSCRTDSQDLGLHVVCAIVTDEFGGMSGVGYGLFLSFYLTVVIYSLVKLLNYYFNYNTSKFKGKQIKYVFFD